MDVVSDEDVAVVGVLVELDDEAEVGGAETPRTGSISGASCCSC